MAKANPTHVLSVSEEASPSKLKIETITPRWSFNSFGVRRSVVRAMDTAMKAAA
jgi:hypothetical protein